MDQWEVQSYQNPGAAQPFYENPAGGGANNQNWSPAMVNPMLQQINMAIQYAPPANTMAYQDIMGLYQICRQHEAVICELQRQLQQQRQQGSYELPDYLTNDATTGTLLLMRRNSSVVSPFANGTIELIGLLVFEEPYCQENRYQFCVKPLQGNPTKVEIPFSEMVPKKLIERFSVNGGLSFWGSMSEIRKGELLRAFLVPATNSVNAFFVPYFSGWQLDKGKPTMIYRRVTDEERNMMAQSNQLSVLPPLLGHTKERGESFDALTKFTQIFTEPLPAAVCLAWSHYGLLYSILSPFGFQIPLPLYVIGQEHTLTELVVSVMAVFHSNDSACLSILEKKEELEHRLFCARDENIVVDDTASTETKATQQKRIERLQLFQRLIAGNQKLRGPGKHLFKKLEASIVICGKTFPQVEDDLFLLIDSKGVNGYALQKWLEESDGMRNHFDHFVGAWESGWEAYHKALRAALDQNQQEGERLFESIDYARIYAVLASMVDLLLTYVKREGLEASPFCPFLHGMKGELLRFLRCNKEMEDLAGLTMLLRQVLRTHLPEEFCFRLGDADIPSAAEFGVLYDETMVYIPLRILREWLASDGIGIPIPRMLQAAQKDGYLKTYELSKNTYEYKISVRLPDGNRKRLNRIALRRDLFETEVEISPIREAGEHIAF